MLKKLPFLLSLVLVLAVATTGVISAKSAEAAPPSGQTIVDIAGDNPDFSYLVAALMASDEYAGTNYVAALSGKRQFTVFAPTNGAFDAAAQAVLMDPDATGPELVTYLVDSNPALLAEILAYHVAPGNRDAASVLGSTQVRTLSKSFVYPYVDMDGNAFLRDVDRLGFGSPDAQIIAPNVFASNGVIHGIDWVLLP